MSTTISVKTVLFGVFLLTCHLASAIPMQNPAPPSADHNAIILPDDNAGAGNESFIPEVNSLSGSGNSLLPSHNTSFAEFLKLNASSPFTSIDDGNSTFQLEVMNSTEVVNGSVPLPKLHFLGKAPAVVPELRRPLPPPPTIDTSRSACKRAHAILFWSYGSAGDSKDDYPSLNSKPDHYIIYKRNNHPDRNGTWMAVNYIEKITKHELPLSNLKPNTPYSFRLEAVFGDDRRSAPSAPFNCTTFIDIPVRHPHFISAYAIASEPTSVLVKWRPLELSEQGAKGVSYTVYIRKAVVGERTFSGANSNEGDLLEPGQNELQEQSLVVKRVVTQATTGELLIKDRQLMSGAGQRYTVSVEARNPIGVSKAPLLEHEVNFNELKPSVVPGRLNVTKVVDGKTAILSWAPVPVESVNGNFKGTLN